MSKQVIDELRASAYLAESPVYGCARVVKLKDIEQALEGKQVVPVEPSVVDKANLSGEYFVEVEHSCSACSYDEVQDDCEVCGGEINWTEKHTIPWSTIKDIRKAMLTQTT